MAIMATFITSYFNLYDYRKTGGERFLRLALRNCFVKHHLEADLSDNRNFKLTLFKIYSLFIKHT